MENKKWNLDNASRHKTYIDEDDTCIAVMANGTSEDARLIAKAPELLKVLKAMSEVLDGTIGDILSSGSMLETGAYDVIEAAQDLITAIEIPFTQDDMENPFESGTGHYAGYEWAKLRGKNCNRSRSFGEGCEEYFNQIAKIEK